MVTADELMETSPQLRQEFEDNFKLKQDPRITKLVNFAATSLDEFPVLECFER